MGRVTRDPLERFWEKVKRSPEPDGCWVWTGARSHNGYGFFRPDHRGPMLKAHRFAYATFVDAIPVDAFVLHRCDNPACVRPDHLFVGSHRDNMADMARKGRAATGLNNGVHTKPETRQFGQLNVNARLTPDQVRSIRREYRPVRGALVELARKYGVTPQSVRSIVHGETWRHVSDS